MNYMLQQKRTKAQAISAQNKNPHILSRGGYKNLEEKILMEKEKSRSPPSKDDFPARLYHHLVIKSRC